MWLEAPAKELAGQADFAICGEPGAILADHHLLESSVHLIELLMHLAGDGLDALLDPVQGWVKVGGKSAAARGSSSPLVVSRSRARDSIPGD